MVEGAAVHQAGQRVVLRPIAEHVLVGRVHLVDVIIGQGQILELIGAYDLHQLVLSDALHIDLEGLDDQQDDHVQTDMIHFIIQGSKLRQRSCIQIP